MNSWHATPGIGLIDNIVVDKGGRMDHLGDLSQAAVTSA